MKKDPGLTFRISLIVGDAVAIVLAYLFAYLFRIHIDQRPYFFEAEPKAFAWMVILFIPVWVVILAILGLYNKKIFMNRSRSPELLRLLAASVIGTMALITYDFFSEDTIFPTRLVALYSLVLSFIMLMIMRGVLHFVRTRVTRKHFGTLKAVVIGNSMNTARLLDHFADFPEDGYTLSAVVANKKYIPVEFQGKRFTSLKEALKWVDVDVIFQTDENQTDYVYAQSVKYHAFYYFVPSEATLSSHMGDLELIGDTPAILVKVTPLIGGLKFVKRAVDIIFGTLAFIIALIPMMVIWVIVKLSDMHAPVFYGEYRLSRYNQKVKIYKFRSMKPEYSGMSPEQAFKKMGRPELISKYRENGDFLPDDPRITKVGKVLRATSLDELPQLINVIKGDISLVGPRALVPGELRGYGDRSLLLSVKSGLTGLAQVSGRRDISFEERRALDIYYIQNWSLKMDFSIILRTILVVLTGKGAK